MGFGSDIDSWVYADTGFAIFKTGSYFASRGIGFPLYEFLITFILKINESTGLPDWILTNSLSMFTAFVCIILFYKILIKWKIEHRELLLIAFAFMPVIWKNSINTMDYMVSIMFILLSHYLIIEKKYSISAIALGLAVGARPTNGIIFLSFIYLLWKDGKREIIKFSTIFSLVTFCFSLPFLLNYKLLTIEQYRNYMYPQSTIIMNLSKIGYRIFYEFIGIDASIFLIILIMFSKSRIIEFFKQMKNGDAINIFLSSTIILFLLLFLKYPFQAEYLIPLIPSLLILAGRFLKKRNLIIFIFLVILNGFIAIPGIKFGFDNSGNITINPELIGKGTFISDIKERKKFVDFEEKFLKINFKKHSIVIWHEYQAPYVYFNRYEIFKKGEYFDSERHLTCLDYVYIPDRDIYVTYLLPNELLKVKNQHNVYYLPCVIRLIKSRKGINLLKNNPTLIDQLEYAVSS